MPTENRSSNTEMVSVPRVPTREMLNGVCMHPDLARSLWSALLKNAPQPAQQPHPESIAWMVGTAFWWTKEEAERDAAATGLPIVGLGPMAGPVLAEQHQGEPVAWVRFRNGEPDYDGDACMIMNVPGDTLGDGDSWEAVYTHADHCDVDDLFAATSLEFGGRLDAVEKERDILRAQLAKRDALLREVRDSCALWMEDHQPTAATMTLDEKIETALSASAEPSTPSLPRINGHKFNCKAVDDYKPGDCSCGVEIDHEIPGTSFQRLNALANQGE